MKQKIKQILKEIYIDYYNFRPRKFISKKYYQFYNNKLNWENPVLLSEKLQILKYNIYPHNEKVIKAADKYTLHEYLTEKGLSRYSVPIIKVYENEKDFYLEELPESFVLKKTNASGMNLIVKDKNKITKSEIQKKMKIWFSKDYGRQSLEPHYSKSKSRVICEPFFSDLGDEYRLFMVNGEIGYVQIIVWEWDKQKNGKKVNSDIIEGHSQHYRIYCDKNGDILWKDSELDVQDTLFPDKWDEVVKVSQSISKDFPIVRVDFNIIEEQYKITELTFTPANCYLEILKNNKKLDLYLGSCITQKDLL